MRILIIGGTGLISSGITPLLTARGHDVTLYNRGTTPAQFEDTTTRIVGDRRDSAVFEARMADSGHWDCVIDMICFTPDQAESAVRAFREHADQYLFCSTVDVYRKTNARYPITEDAPLGQSPAFPYALNKGKCEAVFRQAHAAGDLCVTTIRPAHTYGEGGGLLHTMGFATYVVDRLRKGQAIIVHGNGRSLWSAAHRDDVAVAFANAAGNPDAYGCAYHVAADEWLTWDRYYQLIAQAAGAPEPTLVHIPTDTLMRVVPEQATWCAENFGHNNIFDNAAAKRDLGYRYTIPFIEGIGRVIAWCDAYDRIEPSERYPFYDHVLGAWERASAEMERAYSELAD